MNFTVQLTNFEAHSNQIKHVRQTVFVEEQGIDPKLEWDKLDDIAHLVIACDSQNYVIATARFFDDGKIGRMAVLPAWRRQGIGRAMLELIVSQAKQMSIARLKLSAQTSAIAFYEKNGFVTQGKPYMEAGILHQDMFRIL